MVRGRANANSGQLSLTSDIRELARVIAAAHARPPDVRYQQFVATAGDEQPPPPRRLVDALAYPGRRGLDGIWITEPFDVVEASQSIGDAEGSAVHHAANLGG